MENKNTNQIAGGYTLFIDEPGREFVSQVSGRTLKTSQRRVEIEKNGVTVADFVMHSKSQPTAMHPDEVALARKVLAMLNS